MIAQVADIISITSPIHITQTITLWRIQTRISQYTTLPVLHKILNEIM